MIKAAVKTLFNTFGISVSRHRQVNPLKSNYFPKDFEADYVPILKKVRPFTMTSNESLYQLILCVKYIIENNIKGDFVECGVWRGGSILAIIETLKMFGIYDRKIHLFDTFKSDDIFSTLSPTDADKPFDKSFEDVTKYLNQIDLDLTVDLKTVEKLMVDSLYPLENIVFHVGRVEETIEKSSISSISLLRLDTDWYDSTKFQLESFYNKVNRNGVVICDDYGFWQGHKKAVSEFLLANKIHPLIIRTDSECSFFLKNI